MRHHLPLLMILGTLACSPVSRDLDAKLSPEARRAPYPRILPIEEVLATPSSARLDDADAAQLSTRAADLQRRAAILSEKGCLPVAPATECE